MYEQYFDSNSDRQSVYKGPSIDLMRVQKGNLKATIISTFNFELCNVVLCREVQKMTYIYSRAGSVGCFVPDQGSTVYAYELKKRELHMVEHDIIIWYRSNLPSHTCGTSFHVYISLDEDFGIEIGIEI